MTLSTSAVAVCCCSDSVRSPVRWRSSLSSRVFSMAMTAWLAKFWTSSICLSVNEPYLQPVDDDHPDQPVVLEHRNRQKCPRADELGERDAKRIVPAGLIRHNVFDVNGLLGAHYPAKPGIWAGAENRILPPILGPSGGRIVHGHDAQCISLAQMQFADLRFAKAGRVRKDRLEYRLQLTGRGADHAQYFRGRGLLLQRFAQIVGALAQLSQQPRVLDGDDRLMSKVLDQLDLLVREQANILAIDGNSANQLIPLEHWHQHERARPRELYQGGACVWFFFRDVGKVDDLPCLDEAANIDRNCGVAPSKFFELTRSAMHSHQPKLIFLE